MEGVPARRDINVVLVGLVVLLVAVGAMAVDHLVGIVAGAGLALGLLGRRGSRRVEATAAVAIGALVLVLGPLA